MPFIHLLCTFIVFFLFLILLLLLLACCYCLSSFLGSMHRSRYTGNVAIVAFAVVAVSGDESERKDIKHKALKRIKRAVCVWCKRVRVTLKMSYSTH